MNFITETVRRTRDAYATRSDPENLYMLANAYWRGLLMVAVTGLVCSILFGMYVFWSVVNTLGATAKTSSTAPSTVLSRADLNATLNAILVRQASYDAARSGLPPVADPSR